MSDRKVELLSASPRHPIVIFLRSVLATSAPLASDYASASNRLALARIARADGVINFSRGVQRSARVIGGRRFKILPINPGSFYRRRDMVSR